MKGGNMTKKTKEIGRKIGMQLKEIKQQEKALRTLEKEKEVRDRREKLNMQIKALKKQRPTFFKKAWKVSKTIGKGLGTSLKTLEQSPVKKSSRKIRKRKVKKRRTRKPQRRFAQPKPQRDDLMDYLKSI